MRAEEKRSWSARTIAKFVAVEVARKKKARWLERRRPDGADEYVWFDPARQVRFLDVFTADDFGAGWQRLYGVLGRCFRPSGRPAFKLFQESDRGLRGP